MWAVLSLGTVFIHDLFLWKKNSWNMDKEIFKDCRNEYWFHVSNQNEIPIIGHAGRSIDSNLLYTIAHCIAGCDDEFGALKEIISENVDAIDTLRTVVGITDKRMYLELSYIFNKQRISPEKNVNVLGESIYTLKKHIISYYKNIIKGKANSAKSQKVLDVVAQYLCDRGVLKVLRLLGEMGQDGIDTLVDCLLLPKEIQQEETKRRGHGAEQKFAVLLYELGVSFIPNKRHENPMSQDDPNIDKNTFELAARNESSTWSMDLIIKDKTDALRIFVQGLIHTSDPGQYGVNKSAETCLVKSNLMSYNTASSQCKELWGLVDGVGFIENPEHTVFKMIKEFDTFVQLKSLYKAGLRLHRLGIVRIKAIRFNMDFYSEEEAEEMFELYGSKDIQVVESKSDIHGKEIEAGMAWLYI